MTPGMYLQGIANTEWEAIVSRTAYDSGPTHLQLRKSFADAMYLSTSGIYGVQLSPTVYVHEVHLIFTFRSPTYEARQQVYWNAVPVIGTPALMTGVLGLPVTHVEPRLVNAAQQVNPQASPSPNVGGRRMEFEDVEMMTVPEPKPLASAD